MAVGNCAIQAETALNGAANIEHSLIHDCRLLAAFARVTRVLTSGGAADAWSGRTSLAGLVAKERGPVVLAGAGIGESNVRQLIAASGVREIHVGNGARTNGRVDPQRVAALKRAMNAG